jgi:hypothetical protein
VRRWTPFRRTYIVHNRLTGEETRVPDGVEYYGNDLYNVQLRRLEASHPSAPPLIWLSISRKDRDTIKDWRDLQRIKNELVGPECEGVEIYPAESRLVDTSNQFHLWVVDDPTFRWPFGYTEREIRTPDEVALEAPGAVQRPFEQEA